MMARAFGSVVAANGVLWLATGLVGLNVAGDRLFTQHFALAMFTLLLTLGAHAGALTYFSATGRMISQAVFIGHLSRTPLERVAALKRGATIRLGAGCAVLLPLVAFGGLAARDPSWHSWHLVSALLAMAINAWAFFGQYEHIVRQSALLDEVLAAYDAARPAGQSSTPPSP